MACHISWFSKWSLALEVVVLCSVHLSSSILEMKQAVTPPSWSFFWERGGLLEGYHSVSRQKDRNCSGWFTWRGMNREKFYKETRRAGGSTKRSELFRRDQDAGFAWGWSLQAHTLCWAAVAATIAVGSVLFPLNGNPGCHILMLLRPGLTLPELRFNWKLLGPIVAGPLTIVVNGTASNRQKSLFFPISSSFPCSKQTGSQSPAVERRAWKNR